MSPQLRRIVSIGRPVAVVAGLSLSLATSWSCGNDQEVAPTVLNFNRPTDIAFACYGGLRLTNGSAATMDQQVIITAQPTQACDIRSGSDDAQGNAPFPPGQGTIGTGGSAQVVPESDWYAFVLQSQPGTVGLAQWNTKPASSFTGGGDVTVLDADPLTPGKSGITIGEQPIGIETDQIGCYIVSANQGTCDLSALSVTDTLNYQADQVDNTAPTVTSIPVTGPDGMPLRSKPAAIVGEPAGGTIGNACPATPTGIAYIAYPSCHLVAAIDTSTGSMVAGIQFDADGTPAITTGAVTCPDECSGGGAVTAGTRPTSLDLENYSNSAGARRVLAIGAPDSNVVTLVDLSNSSLPTSLSRVVFEQDRTGQLGINKVKVSPIIGMGGASGMLNDATSAIQMQFVYAIATDSTIRVANIYGDADYECDTQVDPRYLHGNKLVSFMSCMGNGSAGTPPRRPEALGPGIQLPNRQPATNPTQTTSTTVSLPAEVSAFTTPESIEIFQIQRASDNTEAAGTPDLMIGYFGVIAAANGQTYVLNVDDDDWPDFVDPNAPIGTAIPFDIAHQLRDAVPERYLIDQAEDSTGTEQVSCADGPDPDSSSGNMGGPRSVDAIVQTLPANILATTKAAELPSVRQVSCTDKSVSPTVTSPVSELSFAAPLAVRDAEYPDIMGMSADETWTLTFEGSLSIDTDTTATNGPPVRTSMISVDGTGMYMQDQTQPFCSAGVEPWDIVQIRGCDPTLGNADCPPNYVCFVHPDSQVTGIGACMLSTEADRLATACREYLVSQRRYTIGKTTAGQLTLLPRKHVLRTSPVDGCTSDTQCQTLADYALQNNSPNDPSADQTFTDTHKWSCQADPTRAPDTDDAGNLIDRCIETCTTDADCDVTNVCQNGLCYEGIEPPQACVNSPQMYELRAGEAFAVEGTLSGFTHPIIADANGNCIKNPNASPFQISRLPLRAPACDPTADPRGILPDGITVEANPCETTVTQVETENVFTPGTCTVVSTQVANRQADAIVFRNQAFNLTLIDPTYPGDAACIGDRMGTLGKIPLIMPLGQLSERITAGFTPFLLNIQPTLPVKVVKGPTNSIWVVDSGDYLSTDVEVSSTEGKVYRVESASVGIINLLE